MRRLRLLNDVAVASFPTLILPQIAQLLREKTRSATRQAFVSNIRKNRNQHQVPRQSYSTAKKTTSSSFPWIIFAVVTTASGVWLTMGSSKPTDSLSLHNTDTKREEHKTFSPEEEEKKRAHMASIAKDAIKPEHGGSSVLNHGHAAEANEHKMRKGIFSGREFDNHVAKHSEDPGKDFEFIEKNEAKGAPK